MGSFAVSIECIVDFIQSYEKTKVIELRVDKLVFSLGRKKYVALICNQCHSYFCKRFSSRLLSRNTIYCSNVCVNKSQRDGEVKRKKEKHFLEKYGVTNPYAAPEIIQNKVKTFQERYGVDNPSQLDFVKEKKLKTLKSDPLKQANTSKKRRMTNLERYGVEEVLSAKFIRDALEAYSLREFNVKHFMQSKTFINEHFKPAFMKKYGVDNPQKVEHIKLKTAQTTFERYGVTSIFKLQRCKDNARAAMIRNALQTSSNAENKFYKSLLSTFDEGDIERQVALEHTPWLIDFYIKSLNVYVQFDGIFWHGLSMPYETLLEKSKTSLLMKNVLNSYKRDKSQDKWFKNRDKTLVRITDVEFIDGIDILEKLR